MEYIVINPSQQKQHKPIECVLQNEILSPLFMNAFVDHGIHKRKHTSFIISDIPNTPSLKLSKYTILNTKKDILDTASSSKHEYAFFLNGMYLYHYDSQSITTILQNLNQDIIAISFSPDHSAYREEVRMTRSDQIVGFKRYYDNSIHVTDTSDQWPHLLCVRKNHLKDIDPSELFKSDFNLFTEQLNKNETSISFIEVAGNPTDLTNTQNLHCLLLKSLADKQDSIGNPLPVSDNIYGTVIVGENVNISNNAVVIGPTVLLDNVCVKDNAVVIPSVIADSCIEQNEIVQNQFLDPQDSPAVPTASSFSTSSTEQNVFRKWPFLSYVHFGKRIFDVLFSLIVLLLFAPIFLIVTAAIKLTSPGPIFYRARRQGLHGKEFDCLKFRSMITTADTLQDKLRFINQVDGPQFKMENDPRISKIGRFLRDTCIDEIPQFINVLIGQMSVVGPRPSPAKENSQCPYWREARLSVRPGITGLWQIYRTREPSKDFQEWVYYDTQYVRKISFGLDLKICWKTATKLLVDFIDQF